VVVAVSQYDAVDEDFDYDDDWYDDEPSHVKEEPDCHWRDCYDSGFYTDDKGRERPCPACNPTRLQHALWLLRWRVRDLFQRLFIRRARGNYDDEAPF
jgi:hypothetical protein